MRKNKCVTCAIRRRCNALDRLRGTVCADYQKEVISQPHKGVG